MTTRAGDALPSGTPVIIRESLQGRYSGFASRFTGFAVDVGISLGVFLLALAAISWAALVLTGKDITWHKGDIWMIIAYAVWAFVYFAHSCLAVPVLHPAWSGGCPGIASAFSTGIRVPSGLTSRTGTLTSRTPLSYRAAMSAGSTLAGSLTVRASDP